MNRSAAVLIAFNQVPEQFELTKDALQSLLKQDTGPLDILVIDNGSTIPQVWDHFQRMSHLHHDYHRIHTCKNPQNFAPTSVINRALRYFFNLGYDEVLGIPDDVVIPENCYRLMNEWPRGLVTASETKERDFPRVETASAVSECTPAAVAVVRKWFYDALVARDGYYLDENFFMYASDCDFAVRMTLCGIRGIQLNLPYWHYGSAHWRMLSPEEGRKQTAKADADRAYFLKKWGFTVDSWEYGKLPADFGWQQIQASQKALAASHGSK